MKPTHYEPFDGDYIDADYGNFFDDIQIQNNYDFGEYPEICVTLEEDRTIRVLGANVDQDNWIWDRSFAIPGGWDWELVQKMFEGTVYLEPSNKPKGEQND